MRAPFDPLRSRRESGKLHSMRHQKKTLIPDFSKALAALTRWLARRDHSEHEMRQKLSRYYTPEVVERVIVEAKESRWILPPAELAQKWFETLNRRKRSHGYIQKVLKKHRLPDVSRDRDAEFEKCLLLVETKFKKTANFDRIEQGKVARFLQYRGFDSETIRRVIYEKS